MDLHIKLGRFPSPSTKVDASSISHQESSLALPRSPTIPLHFIFKMEFQAESTRQAFKNNRLQEKPTLSCQTVLVDCFIQRQIFNFPSNCHIPNLATMRFCAMCAAGFFFYLVFSCCCVCVRERESWLAQCCCNAPAPPPSYTPSVSLHRPHGRSTSSLPQQSNQDEPTASQQHAFGVIL